MINMLTAGWMPTAISWIIVMAKDSRKSRQMFASSIAMTNIAIMGGHWMGYFGFIMAATDSGRLWQGANVFFFFFYLFASAGMVVFQWFLSPDVYNWIKNAPLARTERNIDALCTECPKPFGDDTTDYDRCEAARVKCEKDNAEAEEVVKSSDTFSKFQHF